MAYQRLRRARPADRALEQELGKLQRVELRLEQRRDGFWLICSDTGVGMNKHIIENHLLVSGQPRRHDVAQLERRCQEAGFTMGRTAEFGIGVLSYFMIADRLRLGTRRAPDPKDGEAHGWTFESEGVGSWGELRPEKKVDVGTRVELHLKPGLFDDAALWYAGLSAYLLEALLFVPCEFHVNSVLPGCEPLALGPGWTRSWRDLGAEAVAGLREEKRGDGTPPTLLPMRLQLQAQERTRRWHELREEAAGCLRWVAEEGDLPNGSGRYRLHLPYFELAGGPSLAFMDASKEKQGIVLRRIGQGFSYRPRGILGVAWKGMRVQVGPRLVDRWRGEGMFFLGRRLGTESEHVGIEIDFRKGEVASLEVNRESVILTEAGAACLKWLREKCRAFSQQFVLRESSSRYATLNARLAGLTSLVISKPRWVMPVDPAAETPAVWGPVKFPALDSTTWKYEALPPRLTWKGKEVSVLPCVRGPRDDDHYDGLTWHAEDMRVDRLVHIRKYPWTRTVAPLWERSPWRVTSSTKRASRSPKFPPVWRRITGVKFGGSRSFGGTVWNAAHHIIRLVTPEAWNWAEGARKREKDPRELRDELVQDRAQAAAWVLGMLEGGAADLWNGLVERDPGFVEELWKVVFPRSGKGSARNGLALWVEDSYHSRLWVITSRGWRTYRLGRAEARDEIDRWMPDPGPDWTVQVETEREYRPRSALAGSQPGTRKKASVAKRAGSRGKRKGAQRRGK